MLRRRQRHLQLVVDGVAQRADPRLKLRPTKHGREDLLRVGVGVVALQAVAAEGVVHGAALLVEERLIGVAELLELLRLGIVARMLVRVAVAREAVVGLLDLRRCGIRPDGEEVVVGGVHDGARHRRVARATRSVSSADTKARTLQSRSATPIIVKYDSCTVTG